MQISERLRRSRKNLNMTLKDVNAKTGLSVSFLSEVERGKTNPSIETIQKLADCYKVPIKELMPDEIRVLPVSLEEAKKQHDIPDEIIELMLKVKFRTNKKYDNSSDWTQLYFSIKTLLGE